MPKPAQIDIADRGEVFVRIGGDIKAAIAQKVNDRLGVDMTNNMNEIEKAIEGYEGSDLVGLIVGLTEPEKLSAKGKVIRELALSAGVSRSLASELSAVAHNIDESCYYVLNFEQITRYGLDVYGKA